MFNQRWRRITASAWICSALALVSCSAEFPAPSALSPADAGGTDRPLAITMLAESFGGSTDLTNEYFSLLQEQTGVALDIEWIPTNEYDDYFILKLASNQLPDVVVFDGPNNPALIQALRSGVFWDLTPFLGDFSDYPNLRGHVPSELYNYVKFRGRIMAVPRARSYVDHGIKIRKDWLDALHIPVPLTLDEYRSALKRMVYEDPDGNGIADTIGLIEGPFMNKAIMNAFGLNEITYDDNGYIIRDILTPQAAELVRWYRSLYQEGVLARPFAVTKRSYIEELLFSGKLASYTYSIYYDYSWEANIRKVQPSAELITLPVMTGPRGNTAYLQKGFTGAFYISSKVPENKVKDILSYFDRTASPEITDFAYFGQEGVHYIAADGERKLTELGLRQLGVTSLQPLAPGFSPWSKVRSALAPASYNDAKIETVSSYAEVGRQNPFDWLESETWSDVWPRFEAEFEQKVLEAVMGKIAMEEYARYVEQLRATSEMRLAFFEYKQSIQSAPPKQ